MNKEEIGAILKELRLKSGKTQREVAELLGRKQQIIGHWETGYSQPDANTLFMLCDIYNASVDLAFGFKTKRENLQLTKYDIEIISTLHSLNEEAYEKTMEYISDLVATGRYKKPNTLCVGGKEVKKQA